MSSPVCLEILFSYLESKNPAEKEDRERKKNSKETRLGSLPFEYLILKKGVDDCIHETEFVCRWFIPVLSVSCHLSIAPSENLARVGTDFSRVLFWVKATS
ncbi:hypothetical protein CDAR_18581 [Caerostris darwini]|uniref:Uncharacterized protein n=1 Tax=Caerostris darwini TaxID=1538125 RepID=A0AAV4V905_9ARAC|nr:hypothetical protein CDAR_18581 [Caerostris darwini]